MLSVRLTGELLLPFYLVFYILSKGHWWQWQEDSSSSVEERVPGSETASGLCSAGDWQREGNFLKTGTIVGVRLKWFLCSVRLVGQRTLRGGYTSVAVNLPSSTWRKKDVGFALVCRIRVSGRARSVPRGFAVAWKTSRMQDIMDPKLEPLIQSNAPLDDSQAHCIQLALNETLSTLVELEREISKTLLSLLKLEHERRRQTKYGAALKGALSPLRRIPSEILAEIFLACRDDSLEASDYSITDLRQAPMLLGRVSARWRQVCHDTPRLWDHFVLPSRENSVYAVAQSQIILSRSRTLPLHINLGARNPVYPSDRAEQELFDLIFQQNHRLKQIRLNIWSAHPSPLALDHPNLPMLTSLEIIVNVDRDIIPLLVAFKNAPQMRILDLTYPRRPMGILASVLPWGQLTVLYMSIPISLRQARDILVQCERVEDSIFNDLDGLGDIAPPQTTCQLTYLRRLTIEMDAHDIPDSFFAAFSFPNLASLTIWADDVSPRILSNLWARSKFNLSHLEFHFFNGSLHTNGLIDFLRHLHALQTLDFKFCHIEDSLLTAFTYRPEELTPSFSLPKLRSFTLGDMDWEAGVLGPSIAQFAESVCAYTGQNAAFPALAAVHLYLDGLTFDAEIEARIAATCATGLVTRHN
ncbi:hypothetical protein FB451DRAFT_1376786 [Mycena latifolia]|nr:hypothetical protein FB451DRAFT_1376786 [Mycena latifolia]